MRLSRLPVPAMCLNHPRTNAAPGPALALPCRKHELRVTRLVSLLQHLHGSRDDSRRGSSMGSSLRSSRDPSPSALFPNRGGAFGSMFSARPGIAPVRVSSSCLSRSTSLASSTTSLPTYDATGRRYSNSSGSGSSNGGGGPASGARSTAGSGGGGADSASWVHVGTPPAAPSALRRSDSEKSSSSSAAGSCGGCGPWGAVCPAAPAVPAPGAATSNAALQLMPTLADGIVNSQLESGGNKANVSPAAALPPKAGAYVPPARRSADGRHSSGGVTGTMSPIQVSRSGGGTAQTPDLAAAAAQSLAPNTPHATAASDSPAMAPSSPMQQHPAPIISTQLSLTATERVGAPQITLPTREGAASGPTSPLPPASPSSGRRVSPAAPDSPSGGNGSILRCTAPPYVPSSTKPPLASPPAKRAPLSHALVPTLQGAIIIPPPPPPPPSGLTVPSLNSALTAMLADVMAKQTEGNAAAFAAAAAMAAAAGPRPPPPPPPRTATPPGGSPVPPSSPRGAACNAPRLCIPLAGLVVPPPPPPPPRTLSPRQQAAGALPYQATSFVSPNSPTSATNGPAAAISDVVEAKKAVSDILAGLLAPMAQPVAGARAQKATPVQGQQQQQAGAAVGVGAARQGAELDSLMHDLDAADAPDAAAAKQGVSRRYSANRAPLYTGVATGAVVVAVRPGSGSGSITSSVPTLGSKVAEGCGNAATPTAQALAEQVAAAGDVQASLMQPAAPPVLRQQAQSDGGVWGAPPTLSEGESGDEDEEDGAEEDEEVETYGSSAGAEGEAPRRRRKRGTRTRGRGGRPRRTTGSEAGSTRVSTSGGSEHSAGGAGYGMVGGLAPSRAPAAIPRPPQRSAPGDSGESRASMQGGEAGAVAGVDGDARKVAGRRDYAAWAAATPEYRAEASAKAAAAAAALSSSVCVSPRQSPPRPARAPSPADDDWRVGRERHSPVAPAACGMGYAGALPAPLGKRSPVAPGNVEAAAMHNAPSSRGPDGSRGFAMGRGRALRAPLFA